MGLLSNRHRRIVFLDEMRGLCLILMIIYHGAYDLVYLFNIPLPFYSLPFRILQLFICCNFILISGVSSRFSRNNIKRGFIVFAAAMLMTLVTWLVMPEQTVRFGVLHLLGSCMILHGLVVNEKPAGGISSFLTITVCMILFGITWGVSNGYAGFFGLVKIKLPQILYSTSFLFPLGFPGANFSSSDYFPLLPWIFLFFAGSGLGLFFKTNQAPDFFYKSRSHFLGRIGRHTLIIYLLHQPVIYGVLLGVFYLLELFV